MPGGAQGAVAGERAATGIEGAAARERPGIPPAANATGTGARIASRRKRLISFGWYGADSHLGFILPSIPSGAPAETCNDIGSGLVNFFGALRDRQSNLLRAIGPRSAPNRYEEVCP